MGENNDICLDYNLAFNHDDDNPNRPFGLSRDHAPLCERIQTTSGKHCEWRRNNAVGGAGQPAEDGEEDIGACMNPVRGRGEDKLSVCAKHNAPGKNPCPPNLPPDSNADMVCRKDQIIEAEGASVAHEAASVASDWSPAGCLRGLGDFVHSFRADNVARQNVSIDMDTRINSTAINESQSACETNQSSIQINEINIGQCQQEMLQNWLAWPTPPPQLEIGNISQSNKGHQEAKCALASLQRAATSQDSSQALKAALSATQKASGPLTGNTSEANVCMNASTDLNSCQYNSQKSCCDQQQRSTQTNIVNACGINQVVEGIEQSNEIDQISQCFGQSAQSSDTDQKASSEAEATLKSEQTASVSLGGCCCSYSCLCLCIILGVGSSAVPGQKGGSKLKMKGGMTTPLGIALRLAAVVCGMCALAIIAYLIYRYFQTVGKKMTAGILLQCAEADEGSEIDQCCKLKSDSEHGLQEDEDEDDPIIMNQRKFCINLVNAKNEKAKLVKEFTDNQKCLKVNTSNYTISQDNDACSLETNNTWDGENGGDGRNAPKQYESCVPKDKTAGRQTAWKDAFSNEWGSSDCALFTRPDRDKPWDADQITKLNTMTGDSSNSATKHASSYLYVAADHPINTGTTDDFCNNLDNLYDNKYPGISSTVIDALKGRYNSCCGMGETTPEDKEKKYKCLKMIAQQESGVRTDLPVT